MINPKLEDVGRAVTYVSQGRPDEHGTITSISKSFVFVQYQGDNHSKATNRCDLHWRTKRT